MRKMEEIFEVLFGQGITEALIERMLEWIPEFREDHDRYIAALEELRKEFGESVDRIEAAVLRESASDLFFSGMQGLKMNYEHWLNPMSPNCTWSQVDYNDYLREDIAHILPAYREAESVLEEFQRRLPEEKQALYDAIAEYQSHLVTVGPKLAHFYGFQAGNEVLRRLIPGYISDPMLSLKYAEMLEKIFGNDVLKRN